MRRAPSTAALALVATTASTIASPCGTAIPTRSISIFGWKPYGGKSPFSSDGPSKEEIEAEKRKHSHIFRKEDGSIDETLYEEMNKREAPVELIGDDVPVKNLPPASANNHISPVWGVDKIAETTIDKTTEDAAHSDATANDALVTRNQTEMLPIDDGNTEIQNFDAYKKSTLSYVSNVDPNMLVGVGLGAGFGESEDKRLGFLRPSKKADAPRTKEEEAVWMAEQKRQGLMDPEEGTEFLDGTVYRPSKTGAEGLNLLMARDSLLNSTDAKLKAKYDAIDKSLRDGTLDINKLTQDKSLSSSELNSVLAAISSQGYGGPEPYNAERAYALAKTDEEKRLIRERQRKLAQLQLASVLKRMTDWRGTTFSPNEHFLLADLDYNRDSLLFGRTREEFEENVKKMKKVIIDYTKWERGDNFFKYGTWFLKFFAFYLVLESYRSVKARDLLVRSYDDFTTVVTETINELEARRNADIDRAIAEWKIRPPDFAPLKASIEAERQRIRAERAAKIKEEEINEELHRRELALAEMRAGGGDSSPEIQKLRAAAAKAAALRLSLAGDATVEGSQRQHPMDTTGITYTKNTEDIEGIKDALFKSDELSSRVKVESPMDAGLAADNTKVSSSTSTEKPAALKALGSVVAFAHNPISGIGKWFGGGNQHKVSPTFTNETERQQQQQLHKTTSPVVVAPQSSDPLTSLTSTIAGSSDQSMTSAKKTPTVSAPPPSKQKTKPLTKAEEDEIILTGMAYAVSPTSIEAVKQLRRLLLPKSEDYTHIVRNEMAEYRKRKENVIVFPGRKEAAAKAAVAQ